MKKIFLLILITFISLSHQVSANKWEDKMSKQMKHKKFESQTKKSLNSIGFLGLGFEFF